MFRDERAVKQDPPSKTGSHFQPRLDINLAKERESHAGVEFTTNEVVVDDSSGTASHSDLSKFRVSGLDREAAEISPNGNDVGEDCACCEKLDIVVGDPCPDGKVGAVDVGSDSATSQLNNGSRESCPKLVYSPSLGMVFFLTIKAILEGLARLAQFCTKNNLSRHNAVKHKTQKVISKKPPRDFPGHESGQTLLRPGNLRLELGPA